MKFLSFGEIIWDIFGDEACIGGAPLNFAAHAVKQGAEAYLFSAVGDDELGRDALKAVRHHGINEKFIYEVKAPTGYCKVTLDENSIPSYEIGENVAYDIVPDIDINDMRNFDVLSFGTLALRGENNRNVVSSLLNKNSFKEIYCDVNIRPPFYSKSSIQMCLENATILKISDEELAVLEKTVFGYASEGYTAAARRISKQFEQLKIIIITLGAEGSIAFECENMAEHTCCASKAEVVSTVGAGDSFGAAFVVAYMNGDELPLCLKKASDISAFVVSHTEAVPDM